MKRLRNFMLRLIGMYIPFVLVILGIGACSYIYKDNFLDRFKQEETVDAPESPVLESEEEPVIVEEPVIEEEQPDAVEVDANEGELPADALPGIGECVCPDQSTGTLEEE